MDVKFNKTQEICVFILIVTMLCSISTYSFIYSLEQSAHENKYYEINNVEHVKDFTDIPYTGVNSSHYTLSESGLNDRQKQQIMIEESVIINDTSTFEIDYDSETIVLTTNDSAYIGNLEVNNPRNPSDALSSIMLMLNFVFLSCLLILLLLLLESIVVMMWKMW
jgi:Na+-transporting NADH:ubiquinone oxidoreductase subunit NqrC